MQFWIFFLFIPQAAQAHIKWFVDTAIPVVEPFKLTEPLVMIWLAICAVIIVIGILLERYLPRQQWLITFGEKHIGFFTWIFHILIGSWLIIAALQQILFIPTIQLTTQGWDLFWLAIEAITGGIVFFPHGKKPGGALLLLLYVVAITHLGFVAMLEHSFIIGLVIFFIYNASDWDMSWLRVCTGITLIILGLQEKILHPELAADFLQTHDWNFMQQLGLMWFDNRMFIFSAGITELLFGTILILGIVTRLNTFVMAIFFLTSI